MQDRIKCIIDCDPGVDDAFAMFYALKHKKLDVLAIMSVDGNVNCDLTTRNMQLIAGITKTNADVSRGANVPLYNFDFKKTNVHGNDGFGGVYDDIKNEPLKALTDLSAIENYVKILRESVQKVVIFALGPLTNLAILLSAYPELADKIEVISLMGGGIHFGNIGMVREYNFAHDPEAANIVFNSGVPIIMAGLDVTSQAYIEKDDIEILKKKDSKINSICYNILTSYQRHDPFLHDPLAIMAITDEDIFESEMLKVDIELSGTHTRGMSIADLRPKHRGKNPNCKVLWKIDREKFIQRLFERINSYD